MGKNTDSRIVRTKQLLREAFMELLRTVGFEKITVQSLITKAGISRGSFYLHYEDKYDLLNKIEAEILSGIQEILATTDFSEISNLKNDGAPLPYAVKILEHVKSYDRFYIPIMGPKGDPFFIGKIGEFIRAAMSNFLAKTGVLDHLVIPAEYFFSIFTSAATTIISEWVRNGMKDDVHAVASIVSMALLNLPRSFSAMGGIAPPPLNGFGN